MAATPGGVIAPGHDAPGHPRTETTGEHRARALQVAPTEDSSYFHRRVGVVAAAAAAALRGEPYIRE